MSIRSPKKKSDDDWVDVDENEDDWTDVEEEEEGSSRFQDAIDFATSPLNKSFFQNTIRENYQDKAPVERVKHTGGKSKFQDFIAEADMMGRGAIEGMHEGLGSVLDSFTSPASLVSMGAGGGALGAGVRGLGKTAEFLRRVTQLASIPNVIHGTQETFGKDKTLGERALGAIELAGGAAGVHFPKSSIAPRKQTVKPTTEPIAEPKPVVEETVPVKTEEAPPPPDSASRALEREYEINRSIEELENDPNYNQGAGDPELAGSTPYQAKPETENIVDKLFPGLEKREPKRSFTFDQAPKPRSPITMKDVDAFLRDEDGSADYSKFFQGEDDLGYSVRTNDPDTIDLGEIGPRRSQALEKNVDPYTSAKQNLDDRHAMGMVVDYEDELDNLMRQHGVIDTMSKEMSGYVDQVKQAHDEGYSVYPPGYKGNIHGNVIRTFVDPVDGGTYRVVDPRSTSKPTSRIRGFLSDESGEFNPGALFREPKSPNQVEYAFDWPGMREDGGPERMFHVRGGPENMSTLSETTLRERGMNIPENPLNEFSPDLMQIDEPVFGGTSPRFEQRTPAPELPELSRPSLLSDESGSVGSRASTMRAQFDALAAENAPDEAFAQVVPGAKLQEGQTWRGLAEEYINAYTQMESRTGPKDKGSFSETALPTKKEETIDDVIARLEKEVGVNANKERQAALEAGEVEASPDQIKSIFDQPLIEQAAPEMAPEKPLLRMKNLGGYLKNLAKDERGELDLSAMFNRQESPNRLYELMSGEDLDPGLPIRNRVMPEPDKPTLAGELWDLPKGTMSIDLPFMTSAAFRQASPLVYTKEWFKAWGQAVKAYGSAEAAKLMQDKIKENKNFRPRYKPTYDAQGQLKGYKEMPSIAEEIGVKMTDYDNIRSREEQLGSRLAEKIPGYGRIIKASNRAYAAFLNDLRVNKLENLLDQLDWAGGSTDMVKAKEIGNFINDATGRGSLKYGPVNLDSSANALAKVLWSPRNLASKIHMLGKGTSYAVRPSTYLEADNVARRAYIEGLIRSTGNWWSLAGLAALAGASVSLEPTNSDFGKIRFGNTRVDPGAGFQQLLVLMARMAPEFKEPNTGTQFGKFTSSTTGKTREYGGAGPYDPSRGGVLGNFITSKSHPAARLAMDLFNMDKKNPVHLGDRALEMAMPMMAGDIIELMKEDPSLAAIMAPLSSVGFGTSTYERGSFNDPIFSDTAEDLTGLPRKTLRGSISRF